MTDFMTHQHGIGAVTDLPDRQDKGASLYVEGSSLTNLVLDDQILSSEQFGELSLDFVLKHVTVACMHTL